MMYLGYFEAPVKSITFWVTLGKSPFFLIQHKVTLLEANLYILWFPLWTRFFAVALLRKRSKQKVLSSPHVHFDPEDHGGLQVVACNDHYEVANGVNVAGFRRHT